MAELMTIEAQYHTIGQKKSFNLPGFVHAGAPVRVQPEPAGNEQKASDR
ncbi:hypothetical protein [Albidovulum sp.]|jgi:hypothetical protein